MTSRFNLLHSHRRWLEQLPHAEFARWSADRRDSLLRHHYFSPANSAYRQHCDEQGVQIERTDWAELPPVDKAFLARANYAQQSAWPGRIVLTSTSGTTSTAVTVPQTTRSARTGLGDNFLRALLCGGALATDRHWGIEHRMRRGVITGSQLSMRWLRQCAGDAALVTNTNSSVDEHWARAAAFEPATISSSPGFLARLASHAADQPVLRPRTVLFGGASLDDGARQAIQKVFQPQQIVGFYPTTDAGALGVEPDGDGVYETFSETHWIEIIGQAGQHVAEGESGALVVTVYDNLAAPLIRYRVGDDVEFVGRRNNRLLLRNISRRAEAEIGATLLPLADIARWTAKIQAVDRAVVAVQLVRRTTEAGVDQPVLRIVCPQLSARLDLAARSLIQDFPQLVHQVATGEVMPLQIESVAPDVALKGIFKLPPYVDERHADHRDQKGLTHA